MNNSILYDFVFNFNPYTNLWSAVERDNYKELFNDLSSDKLLKSSNINTLVELIIKYDGDINRIKTEIK